MTLLLNGALIAAHFATGAESLGVRRLGASSANRQSPLGLFPAQPSPRLYDRVVEVVRARHYSLRTEEAYLHRIRRFLLFHNGTHPRELVESDLNRFLTHLAVGENVAASTQNQALAAVLFLYEHVLERPLNRIEGVVRAVGAAGLSGLTGRPKNWEES